MNFLFLSLLSFIVTAAPAEPTILFLGDSLTEGYGLAQSYSYPSLLEKKLKEKGYKFKIINAGISGSTSASAEGRLKWQLKTKPDVLFLALGANDGLRGLDTQAMYKNLEKTIQMAQKEKVKVILAGMKMPLNYGEDYRHKYEAVFTDLAKKYSVTFVPFLLEGVAASKTLNLPDGVHPNERGYDVIATNLVPVMEKTLKELKAK